VPALIERQRRLEASVGWLVSARWVGCLAQAATVVAGHGLLAVSPPVPTVAMVLAFSLGSNAAAHWWIRHRTTHFATLVAGLILIDIALLTFLLASSGGVLNPLSIMYLVYITLAAVMLGSGWTWAVTAICTGLFALLFYVPRATFDANVDMTTHMEAMRLHVVSMWWSFLLAAAVTAYFGSRLSRRLDAQDAELAAARRESERHHRLAALTTLAAGAAHELSTPLGTIAIATEALEGSLRRTDADDRVLDDLALIRRELGRCRQTLDRMSFEAGQAVGEVFAPARAADIIQEAMSRVPQGDARRILIKGNTDVSVIAPREALAQALANLLRNALESDATQDHVVLTVDSHAGGARFTVADRGIGMPPDVLERAGEPFFTTKPPGRGMGLGVFLTRAVVEQLGGHFSVASTPGTGTVAVIELPSAPARA
jgi:two-component system sensor histidine kinase RegB